jgi:formylglycine-generating enzyme required for sulfatase activity
VVRGGGWDDSAGGCCAAFRFEFTPDYRYNSIGFRLARVPVESK